MAAQGSPPNQPKKLIANSVPPSQIRLSWNPVDEAHGYKVYRDCDYIQYVTINATSDTGLSSGTYCYTVIANDVDGKESKRSKEACATLPADTKPPTTPTGLLANAVSSSRIDLSWTRSTDNVGVTAYHIFRNETFHAEVANGTSYSDTEACASTIYCYKVLAVDADGNKSELSVESCATALPLPPSTPTGLVANAVSASRIDLSWTEAVGYRIYKDGAYLNSVTTHSASDTGLKAETKYCYNVSTFDAAGNESKRSMESCATTPPQADVTPPLTPTGLVADAVSPSMINLSWKPSTDNVGVVGYKVYRGSLYLKSVTTNSASDSGVKAGTKYCYTVTAFDAAGNESSKSSQACAVTPPPGGKRWSRQLGTPKDDRASDIAVDAYGNVYMAGFTNGAFDGNTYAGSRDIFLIKHDSAGNYQWSRMLGTAYAEEAFGVAVDSSGNAFITGYSNWGKLDGLWNYGVDDYFLIKYDTDGTKQWSRLIGSTGAQHNNFSEVARGIAVDSSGNAYVTGWTSGSLGGSNTGTTDIFLAKFRTEDGVQLWTRQLGSLYGPGDNDEPKGVAVDSSGNAYITGSTNGKLAGKNLGSWDIFLIKYDTDGHWQWSRQIGTPAADGANGIAVDSSGNVYIAGYTDGKIDENAIAAGARDIFLIKYDANGTKLWSTQTGSFKADDALDIAVDSSGSAYVTGRTLGGIDGNINVGSYDLFYIKYDTNGNKLYSNQLGSAYAEYASGVAVDSSGSAYVTGYTNGGLDGNTNAGSNDLFLIKFWP